MKEAVRPPALHGPCKSCWTLLRA